MTAVFIIIYYINFIFILLLFAKCRYRAAVDIRLFDPLLISLLSPIVLHYRFYFSLINLYQYHLL